MVEIYDIELIENAETGEKFFSYIGIDRDSDEIYQFYIYDTIEYLDEFRKHLRGLDGMIGFNCLNYDYPILHIILTTKFNSLEHFFFSTTSIISHFFLSID